MQVCTSLQTDNHATTHHSVIYKALKDNNSNNNKNTRFQPIVVVNLGVFISTTRNFIFKLGRRICVHTGDARETSYLFQRISIMLQRFNFVLLHDTLLVDLPDL